MATKRSAQERRRSRRRAAVVLVPTVAGVFVAGTAFAYWTTSGAGTATGASGTSASVTVTQTGTAPSGLAPGGTAQPIAFKITNPKLSPQHIANVTIAVTGVTGNDPNSAFPCDASDFDIVQPTAINADLPNGDTNYASSGATIRMIDKPNQNQDDCKNVTVNLSFSAA
ncbi:hypothetical protein [Actinoplanes sp. NPDC049265]|uniref:hypothetical protein n=1 Tax=Actinoplanes sp. NPDC049265 TaxID=3363902 RepID=UPI003715E9E1